MKIFQVTNKYSIRALDERNWVIERKMEIDTKKRSKASQKGLQEANTSIYGYYGTLEYAKEELAELVAKDAADFTELEKWIKEIKKITH